MSDEFDDKGPRPLSLVPGGVNQGATLFDVGQLLPPLDRVCDNCHGEGYGYDEISDQDWMCAECDGSGRVLTDAGKQLREFLMRWAKSERVNLRSRRD